VADDQINVRISAQTAGFEGPVRSVAATAEQSFGRIRAAANGASASFDQLGDSARTQLTVAMGQIGAAARSAGSEVRAATAGMLSGFRSRALPEAQQDAAKAAAEHQTAIIGLRTESENTVEGGHDPIMETERQARDQAEIFAAGERLKLQAAKGNTDQILAIYDEWLREVAAVYGKDSTQYLNLEREKVEAAQHAAEERARAVQQWAQQEAAAELKAAEESQRAWKNATTQIADQIANVVSSVLTGTESIGQAFRKLTTDILKDFVSSSVKSLLTGSSSGAGGGALSTALFGEGGLSGLLGLGERGLLGGLFGGDGLLDGLFGGGVWGSGAADFSGGVGGAEATTGGGLPSGLAGWLGSLFAFQRGGVVPSAQGGWTLPTLGPNGVLARLHSNEMVLPAHISQGLQNMIAGGGPTVGAVNFSVSAMDSQSVAAFFKNNGPTLVAAINQAMRNGSSLMSTA
jgi:hypothetical protein